MTAARGLTGAETADTPNRLTRNHRQTRPNPRTGRRSGDLLAGLGQPGGVDRHLADEPGSEEVERQAVRQATGHRLIAHRVDLELERFARTLARLGRVADVGRLVIRDGDPFGAEHVIAVAGALPLSRLMPALVQARNKLAAADVLAGLLSELQTQPLQAGFRGIYSARE